MEISSWEVLRYLGYRGRDSECETARLSALAEELISIFLENTVPKSVFGIWDCRLKLQTVALDGMAVNSKDLAKHLTGCSRLALLAATLGSEADTLIRRYSVQDMEKAVVAQAVCTAMIEAYCDEIENGIVEKFNLNGLERTTRFSPGYGDFNIAHQKDIINLLNCGKRISLTLTNGSMLAPSKSVTAVIGFAAQVEKKTSEKCEYCAARLCEFKENE